MNSPVENCHTPRANWRIVSGGDSKYDYQAATTAELDFVFLTQWTEVKDH